MEIPGFIRSIGETVGYLDPLPEPKTGLEQAQEAASKLYADYGQPVIDELSSKLDGVSSSVSNFWSETAGPQFEGLSTSVSTFYSETVVPNMTWAKEQAVAGFSYVSEVATPFFSETVPAWGQSVNENYLTPAFNQASTFVTETAPNFASEKWAEVQKIDSEAVRTFFSETVPNYASKTWDAAKELKADDVKAFFAETVPGYAEQGYKLMNEYPDTTRVALFAAGLAAGAYLARRGRSQAQRV